MLQQLLWESLWKSVNLSSTSQRGSGLDVWLMWLRLAEVARRAAQPQTPTETGRAQAEHAVTLTSMSLTKNTQRRRRCIKHRGTRPDTDQVRANLPKPFKHPLQKTPSCPFVHSVSHSKLDLTQKHIHLWESTHLGSLCNRIGDSSDQCETIPVTLMTYYPFHFNPDNRKHVGGKQCAAWVEAKRTNENGNQAEPGGSEGARHWR